MNDHGKLMFVIYIIAVTGEKDVLLIVLVKEFTDQNLIQHEFIKRLQKRYLRENIEIPFPIRTIYMKQSPG